MRLQLRNLSRRAMIAVGLLAAGTAAQADIVTDWGATATEVVRLMSNPGAAIPGSASQSEQVPVAPADMATFHVAVYDTIVAFDGGYDPFAAAPATIANGASKSAAIHEAAYIVLNTLFPSKTAAVTGPAYTTRMAALVAAGVSQQAIDAGRAAGADVANQILALRANDGRVQTFPAYVNGTQPGEYVSPSPATVVGRNLATIRPFSISSASQFRPKGPPKLKSGRYAKDFNEVVKWGGQDSTSPRNAEQDMLASFSTENPGHYYPRNILRFATFNQPVQNARLLAAIWVAHADATIGCNEAKYTFKFWRPFTAIPQAETDGNKKTDVPTMLWAQNVPTPNHPEYPSGHGCAAGSTFEVIRQLRGKKIDFYMDSNGSPAVPLVPAVQIHYTSIDEHLKDNADSRVYGGMHFRFATTDGQELGRRVAQHVLKYGFRRIP